MLFLSPLSYTPFKLYGQRILRYSFPISLAILQLCQSIYNTKLTTTLVQALYRSIKDMTQLQSQSLKTVFKINIATKTE